MKFIDIIATYYNDIITGSNKLRMIHPTDISASGYELEEPIRTALKRLLPEKFLVSQGHVINKDGLVSPQFDIIICDRLATPTLFTTQNDTNYFPIETVIAIGEIKNTLLKKDISKFQEDIKFVKEDMNRVLVKNTIYDGINDDTLFEDFLMYPGRCTKNPLFTFIIAVNNKFKINNNKLFPELENNSIPDTIHILKEYILFPGILKNDTYTRINEDENNNSSDPKSFDWMLIDIKGEYSLELLVYYLSEHLRNCVIEPLNLMFYLTNKSIKKSLFIKLE